MTGQMMIDGIEVADRGAAIQGTIEIPSSMYDSLRLNQHVRIVLTARVASRKASGKRDEFGDDRVSVMIGLGITETRSVKVVEVAGEEAASSTKEPAAAEAAAAE